MKPDINYPLLKKIYELCSIFDPLPLDSNTNYLFGLLRLRTDGLMRLTIEPFVLQHRNLYKNVLIMMKKSNMQPLWYVWSLCPVARTHRSPTLFSYAWPRDGCLSKSQQVLGLASCFEKSERHIWGQQQLSLELTGHDPLLFPACDNIRATSK